ncbi:MAG: HAD hydrolase-like protein [Eubacterium sp.]|nr:HAD hydrolase-like protein [Eubacterium sp.]
MKKYIFLDLDGTITESAGAILSSAAYALKKLGIEDEDPEKKRAFIGPPLTVGFGELYGLSGDQLAEGIRLYREFYVNGGYKDAPLYDGIEETLMKLRDEGRILMMVTSKPKYIAQLVADYHGMERYLSAVIGPVEEKTKAGKEDLIETAAREVIRMIEAEQTDVQDKRELLTVSDIYRDAVMIGDRKYDMEAAKKLGLTAVGALYGYGTREELLQAGADHIAEKPKDILRFC